MIMQRQTDKHKTLCSPNADSIRPPDSGRQDIPTGVEIDVAVGNTAALASGEAISQSFSIQDQHLRLTQVSLYDGSDRCNELVHVSHWLLHPRERLALEGNLFVIENTLARTGKILIKQVPLPHARSTPMESDIRVASHGEGGFTFDLLTAADESHAGGELV